MKETHYQWEMLRSQNLQRFVVLIKRICLGKIHEYGFNKFGKFRHNSQLQVSPTKLTYPGLYIKRPF